MNIAFDALPLMGRRTGIGYCMAGQVSAMTRSHPEDAFTLNYFAARHLAQRRAEIAPFLSGHVGAKHVFCPPYLYRTVSAFVPVPYGMLFGNADVTHFFNYIVPPGVKGKTVVTVHDMVFRAYPETVRGRTRQMLALGLEQSMRRADRIVTDSVFSRSEIVKYYPEHEGKIRVVPCGVDCERFHPVDDPSAHERVERKYNIQPPYFLYLGTLEPRKNLVRLVQAYAAYAEQRSDPAQLVLAGGKGWLYEDIFAKVQELRLGEKVVFTQYVEDADLCTLMSGALAFTFPSLYEGFGMPPLEAMACGTPVMVSDAASLPEVTGDCAVIVKAEDTISMTEGLCRLHEDAALRQKLKTDGMRRAKDASWERSAEQLYEVYREIAETS